MKLLLLLLVSIHTSKKEILLFLFSSWVKLRTEFFPSTLKVNAPFDIKKAIINKLISHAKLISFSKTIFYKEKTKQNKSKPSSIMGSLIILLMNKLNIQLEMSANKIKTTTFQPINKYLSNFFTKTKCTTIIN